MTNPSPTGTRATAPRASTSRTLGDPPPGPRVPVWRVVAAAWPQHRATLLVASAAVLIAVAFVVWLSRSDAVVDDAGPTEDVQLVMLLVSCYALWVGAFQAAPLLAREYEHRTHLFAWSQDVSPGRWLAGKVALLLAFAVSSALLLGAATRQLVLAHPAVGGSAFDVPYFDASPLVQVGHVVFAFALGLALGLLVKRGVTAMSLTFVGFLAARIVTAFWIRPYYLPPAREVYPLGEADGGEGARLVADVGYLTSAGHPVDPGPCWGAGDVIGCLERADVVSVYLDVQPADRLVTFQLIETGLALTAALVLGAPTWIALRRTGRG